MSLTAVGETHLPETFFGPANLVDLVRHRARCQPDDLAFAYLVDGENEMIRMTNAELDRQARAIAAWLESLDMVGQRALLLYPPGLEFVAAFFGCLYAGVTACPVYPPRRNRSLERIQAVSDDAGARVALTTDVVLKRVEGLIDETPHLKSLTWMATCHVPDRMEDRWEMPDITGQTLAFLQYTSGSTGTPKGVMLNHANLIHNSAVIADAFEHTLDSKGVFWLPSYHDMGLIGGILQPLYVGRPNILMSPMSFLTRPYRWLSAISRFRATTSGGPNFAYDLCVDSIPPEKRQTLDLSCWKVACNGAEPIRQETIERFCEAFEPCGFRREAFYPCFGLAEATLLVSGGRVHEAPIMRRFDADALANDRAVPVSVEIDAAGARGLVGCGRAMPNERVVIVDPQRKTPCPDGHIGEIWVQSPSVAQGYFGCVEATKATFHATLADTGEGPFLRTGDLGFLDQGELFVTGRIKDLIILHGRNHYPQDIERTVHASHSQLRPNAGAVFSVPTVGRERLVVVQELKRRSRADLDQVIASVRRAIAETHEIPVAAIMLLKTGSIPKTSSGKIQRFACRDAFLADTLQPVARWDAEDEAVSLENKTTAAKTTAGNGAASRALSAVGGTSQSPAMGVEGDESDAADHAAGSSEKCHRRLARGNGNGKASANNGKTTTEIVIEYVRKVARGRADGLSLDARISEIGLDSLERMEILALLEQRFGGRFPEDILPDLETCRQVVDAVQTHLQRGDTSARHEGRDESSDISQPSSEIPSEDYQLDQFPEYVRLQENLEVLRRTGLGLPLLATHEGVVDDRTRVDGRELVSFASFNYLGMADEESVLEAARLAMARHGMGTCSSRLVSGERPVHQELETVLAEWLGVDESLAMPSGGEVARVVLGHLLGPRDLVLFEASAGKMLAEATTLSGAKRLEVPADDFDQLDRLLEGHRGAARRAVIVVEAVDLIEGRTLDLSRVIALARRHKALLAVDQTHGLGVLGSQGRGIAQHQGIDPREVDIWFGTFETALASTGGYVAGSRTLVESIRMTAPGFVHATALAPSSAAAALAAMDLIRSEPERVARLQANSQTLRSLLASEGFPTGASAAGPMVPAILGSSARCVAASLALFEQGYLARPVLYPAVPETSARLRFFPTSRHDASQLAGLVEAFRGILSGATSQGTHS